MKSKEQIADKIKEYWTLQKRRSVPNYRIPARFANNDKFWLEVADILVDLDADPASYVNLCFAKYGSGVTCNMLKTQLLRTMYQKLPDYYEQRVAEAKDHIKRMANLLQVKLDAGFSPMEILTDPRLYLDASFRYVFARYHNHFMIADKYKEEALAFLKTHPEYIDAYGKLIPEELKCEL